MRTAIAASMAVAIGLSLVAAAPADARKRRPRQTTTVAAPAPVLNSGVVLFMDPHRIERTRNAYSQYRQGRKVQVAGRPYGQVDLTRVTRYTGTNDAADGDKDTDSRLLDSTTVIHEGGRYRMWLRSGPNVGYRESSDGLHWHIRDPDSVILVAGVNGGSVVKDPVTKLYFLLGWSRAKRRYIEMVSRDGLKFSRTNAFTGMLPLVGELGDVITASADQATGSLLVFAKQRSAGERRCPGQSNYYGGRTFGINISGGRSNARYWRPPAAVLTSDCIDNASVPPTRGERAPVQLYGASFQRYGDQYLAFPWLLHVTKAIGWGDGTVDTQMAATATPRTGWTRPKATVKVGRRMARPNAIQRGPNGAWDDEMVYGTALLNTGGRTRLYYNGWDSGHNPEIVNRHVRVGAVSWTHDRFMSLRTINTRRASEVRTKAFRLPAQASRRNLYVNVDVNRRRMLRVAVVDARTGRTIPGYRTSDSKVVMGDKVSAKVTWNGKNLGRLRSRPIKLVFGYSGSLYSFQVR